MLGAYDEGVVVALQDAYYAVDDYHQRDGR